VIAEVATGRLQLVELDRDEAFFWTAPASLIDGEAVEMLAAV